MGRKESPDKHNMSSTFKGRECVEGIYISLSDISPNIRILLNVTQPSCCTGLPYYITAGCGTQIK